MGEKMTLSDFQFFNYSQIAKEDGYLSSIHLNNSYTLHPKFQAFCSNLELTQMIIVYTPHGVHMISIKI